MYRLSFLLILCVYSYVYECKYAIVHVIGIYANKKLALAFEKAVDIQVEQIKSTTEGLLKISYLLAKEDIDLSKFPTFVHFCKLWVCDTLQCVYNIHNKLIHLHIMYIIICA